MQTVSLELHPVRHADVFNMLTSGLLPLFINESFGDPAFSCAAALAHCAAVTSRAAPPE
jgi:hypothetical protein